MAEPCPTCGFDVDHFRGLLDEKEDALRDLEHELRRKRARITELTTQQAKRPDHDPFIDDADRIFDYWKQKLAPKAREFSGKRRDNVLARLRAGHEVEDIKLAIDGCALKPYVSRQGRSANGSEDEREADLELICRTETHLTRFQGYARAVTPETTKKGILPSARILAMQTRMEAPRVLQRLYELRSWRADAITSLGLGLDDGHVIFFAADADNVITGFSRYQPNPALRSGPKNIAQGARELFPAPEEYDTSTVWLVEGEPDAVAMRSIGLPVVAVPGVATWKEGWAERFENFSKVYVCFDCDAQGREAARIRQAQLAVITESQVVELEPGRTDGYDVNDLLMDRGEATGAALASLATVTGGSTKPIQSQIGGEMPYDMVMRKLEAAGCRVKEVGRGKATSQCPNHDDRMPSLSFSEGDDGRVLLHCHAGCETEAICASLDIELRDLFAKGM